MKRILLFLTACLAIYTGCTKYGYNTNFTAPDKLTGTESVIAIDPDNVEYVILKWSGGGAQDGSIVLYDVLFDHTDGDFSEPFYIQAADNGTAEQLSLRHTDLNAIAKASGISPAQSGSFKWTVRASKGGIMKIADAFSEMEVIRPDILDVPEHLYVFGTALPDNERGMEMEVMENGRFFVNVTFASDGDIWFSDSQNPDAPDAICYWYDSASEKLMQGDGRTTVTASGMMDITLDLIARTYAVIEHFDRPADLYIQGDAAEKGQHFRKISDTEFVLFTKFLKSGYIYFTTTQDPAAENTVRYYIDNDGELVIGNGFTHIDATVYNADRITVNTLSRDMTVEQIGEIRLEWVNAMVSVDSGNPSFEYVSDGNFTLTFDIPVGFEHVDEENKGGTAATDARYFIKVNYDPSNPMPSNDEIKSTPEAERRIKRWGCSLTKDYNMTISPYDRKHTSGITHAEYWLPAFETGELDGAAVDAEEIVEEPYYVYSEMPKRWQSNYFFKTAFAGSTRTATIYTNKDNKMSVHIE